MQVNTENSPDLHVLAVINGTIASKAWYGLTDTGGFNWPASVGKMTESLRNNLAWQDPNLFDTVRGALESAFTPDCLTKVDREPFVAKLAGLARTHGHNLIVWTVGDVGWQQNKAERTGIFALGVNPENFRCTPENKREGLLAILKGIREQKPGEDTVHAFVLDDKESVISDIRRMREEAKASNIVLHDFHVKLNVRGATPEDAYKYLQKESAGMGDNAFFISDYDGVIADTDEALQVQGTKNIFAQFVKSVTP